MAAFLDSKTDISTTSLLELASELEKVLRNDVQSFVTLTTGIIIATLGPITAVANGVVIVAIWQDPFKQLFSSPSNIIIASMAACDFLVGTFCSVLQAFWFISLSMDTTIQVKLTLLTIIVTSCFIGVSMVHILALTTDRVIAVANPLLYKSRVTRKRVLRVVLLIWIIVLITELTLIPLYKYKAGVIQTMAIMVIVGIVEITLPGLCIYIIIKTRRQTKQMRSYKESGVRVFMKKEGKTTKAILVVLTLFLLCLPPFLVISILMAVCFSCKEQLDIILIFFCLSTILANLNSCVNPFLYAFRLPKFGKAVALTIKRITPCVNFLKEKETSKKKNEHEKNLNADPIDKNSNNMFDTKL